MKCEWKYFIVLLSEDCYNDFVEDKEDENGFMPVCVDLAVYKEFLGGKGVMETCKCVIDMLEKYTF